MKKIIIFFRKEKDFMKEVALITASLSFSPPKAKVLQTWGAPQNLMRWRGRGLSQNMWGGGEDGERIKCW